MTQTNAQSGARESLDELREDVFRASRLTGPAYLRESTNAAHSSDYEVHTARGHRNVIGMMRETDDENDAFLEELLRVIDERAYRELVADMPELADDGRTALLADPLTPVRAFNLADHAHGAYELDDLSFNLTPRRPTLLRHLRATLTNSAIIDDARACGWALDETDVESAGAMLDRIAQELDATCSRGDGCYFSSTFFPHVGQHGPVAYGRCVEDVVVDLANRVVTRAILLEVVGAMNQLLVPESEGGGNTRRAGEPRLCICCLLVQQAANALDARSSGLVGPPDQTEMAKPIFIVRGDDDTNAERHRPTQAAKRMRFEPGVERTKHCSYFDSVINVHSSGYTLEIADELDFSGYEVRYEPTLDTWIAARRRARRI